MSTAEKIARKVYADLFPTQKDQTGCLTKKIADIIAAEIEAEAKERDALVEAAQVTLRMMENSSHTCTIIEGRLREALKPFESAATAQGE